MAQARYLVTDVDEAVAFYCDQMGFQLDRQYGKAMAIVTHGDLQLWLAGPSASASQPMADGGRPAPRGWNRIVVTVRDLPSVRESLTGRGVTFLNEVLTGPGGSQCLCRDPSGNVVELFEPADAAP